jgi:hypothetical protein
MVERPGFKTPAPGPLFPVPGGSLWLTAVMWIGSIIFGWMHQALWFVVPPIAFVAYALLEIARGSAWAKREMGLTGREVIGAWKSGLPFRGYGTFMFINPAISWAIFGVVWAASSLYLSST